MPVAPLVSAWGRRFPRSVAGPLSAAAPAGVPLGGVPFCVDEFGGLARLIVEAAFGADLSVDPNSWNWHDITSDVRYADSGRVAISPMGRSDETSSAQPAGCAFVLDNDSGDYTAYRSGRWHPHVRRNTPIRVRVNLTGQAADWNVRFQGYATGWTPSWDISAQVPVVSVQAQGITRRLSQGTSVVQSALWRFHMLAYRYDASTNRDGFGPGFMGTGIQGYHGLPARYWPLEESSGAAQGADVFDVRYSLTATVDSKRPDFGARTVGSGTKPIAVFNVDDTLTATFPTVPLGASQVSTTTMTGLRIPFLFNMPQAAFDEFIASAVPVELLRVACAGTIARFSVWLEPDVGSVTIRLRSYSAAGADLGSTSLGFPDASLIDTDAYITVELNQDGANTSNALRYTLHSTSPNNIILDGNVAGYSLAINAQTIVGVSAITIAPSGDLDGIAVGHLAVYNGGEGTFPTVYPSAVRGRAGESTEIRMRRLCIENGIPLDIVGSSDTEMGPQGVGSVLTLMRECEAADQGILHDGRSAGLSYVTRNARYNADADMAVDAGAGQLSPPFLPVDDDQRNVNLVKADRKTGSSAIFEQAGGPLGTANIGVYDTSLTVNVATEDVLLDYASWRVHLGTVEGFRYPSLTLDFAAVPGLAPEWLTAGVSSRIDVTGVTDVAPQHPSGDVRLLLEGWAEQLSPLDWNVQANTSQYDPWRVGVADTSGYLDCDASVLSTALVAAEQFADGFESGVSLWSGQGGWTRAADATHVRTGSGAMKITPPGATASGGAETIAFFPVTAGLAYVAEAWFYSAAGWADARIVVDWHDRDGAFVSTGLGVATVVPAGVWTVSRQVLTAPASAAVAQPRVRQGGTPAAGDVLWVDDVAFNAQVALTITDTCTWTHASGDFDILINGELMTVTAVSAASGSGSSWTQTLTVIRSVNGVISAHGVGSEVHVADPFYLAL